MPRKYLKDISKETLYSPLTSTGGEVNGFPYFLLLKQSEAFPSLHNFQGEDHYLHFSFSENMLLGRKLALKKQGRAVRKGSGVTNIVYISTTLIYTLFPPHILASLKSGYVLMINGVCTPLSSSRERCVCFCWPPGGNSK